MILSQYQQNYDIDAKNLDESKFSKDIKNMEIQQEILNLADAQFDIFYRHFDDKKGDLNRDNLKMVFEDFGQGILYDPNHDDERTAEITLVIQGLIKIQEIK